MRIILMMSIALSMMMAETTMIQDSKRNLLWEDTMHVEEVKITHIKAKVYCAELTLGGFENWRVPTLKDLLSIVDYKRYKPSLMKEFKYSNKDTLYWSSTHYAKTSDEFWGVSFKDGATSNASETYDRYVRCVRDAK